MSMEEKRSNIMSADEKAMERLGELRKKQNTEGITPEEMEEKAALILKQGALYAPHGRTVIGQEAVEKAVKLLEALCIISENDSLDAYLTKGEAAKIGYILLHGFADISENVTKDCVFRDVSDDLAVYVNFGISKGYLFGIDKEHFGTKNPYSVEQFIVMLDCLLGYTVKGTEYRISDYMMRAYDGGLLRDTSAVQPREYKITKKLAYVLVYNALDARWCYNGGDRNPYGEMIFNFTYEGPHLYPGKLINENFNKEIDGNDITVEERKWKHEPYYVFYKNDGNKKPVVVWIHGTYSTCNDIFNRTVCYRLAEAGYFVVEPELYGHGTRGTDAPIYNADETIEHRKDIDLVLDYIAENEKQADITRVGVCGHSLGAVGTGHYAVKGKYHPKAAVLVAGPMDLERHLSPEPGVGTQMRQWLPGDKAYNFTFTTGETEIHVTKEYCVKQNREASTLPYLENMKDVALLTMRGERDIATDFADDEAKVKAFFAANEHKYYEARVIEGLEHAVTIEEMDEMVEFFDQWL